MPSHGCVHDDFPRWHAGIFHITRWAFISSTLGTGPGKKAGKWNSVFPGEYLKGGKEAGGQLVDQRLLPRISEGEVRMLMVKAGSSTATPCAVS